MSGFFPLTLIVYFSTDTTIFFITTEENATVPRKCSPQAAGFDLFCVEPEKISAGSITTVDTKIKVLLPRGTYGRIASRSSLCLNGLFVQGGVIDRDFQGTIKVIFYNSSKDDYYFSPGERIAQLILEKIAEAEVQIMHGIWTDTARGEGGFGSTGK
ncbi:Deoxyuridine 5'-triphosphate nucleotidohydrolase [Orchesella cincta]|uniref:Deoxyuridine 5'-triphosphate nucleotidohydrolase n=1 Tax=Orchesella cincta TaxID=48709 RepID=A0A1D2M590_ORCCI|nr:Deoxyuridine 5'-triphosphate nucleotidohydrolase [Orchesella cincta]